MKEVRALLLAAGLGTRLRPLTDSWPKCLMPVGGRPLLEHWLCKLYRNGIRQVLVNVHHHQNLVEPFLERDHFRPWVFSVHEPLLLGTAGTLRKNRKFFGDKTVLLVHSDNWCQCDFSDFLGFHNSRRPAGTSITMMTFRTSLPETCGIVEVDNRGVVQGFHEKIDNPPGNLANGAVYLLEPEVSDWIEKHRSVNDFSTQVIPHFIGRIATWENRGVHRDIGAVESLSAAQLDPRPSTCWDVSDSWTQDFENHPIHSQLDNILK
jgi:mannose-1-phosphate guanylyltransferase